MEQNPYDPTTQNASNITSNDPTLISHVKAFDFQANVSLTGRQMRFQNFGVGHNQCKETRFSLINKPVTDSVSKMYSKGSLRLCPGHPTAVFLQCELSPSGLSKQSMTLDEINVVATRIIAADVEV